jgi:hypothetical protein
VVIDRSGPKTEVLTGNFIKVAVPVCQAPEGELVRISITRVLPRRTEGEVIA